MARLTEITDIGILDFAIAKGLEEFTLNGARAFDKVEQTVVSHINDKGNAYLSVQIVGKNKVKKEFTISVYEVERKEAK